MKNSALLVKLICLFLCVSSCSKDRFDEAQELGGVLVRAEQLNRGHRVYASYCSRCHANNGKGVFERQRTDSITDLSYGVYKYALGVDGALPPDEELIRVIRTGLGEKRMPAFTKLTDQQLNDVVQFIKTLSPRWKNERSGTALEIKEDPWRGEEEDASARGQLVYHAVARCWTCHPSLVDEPTLRSMLRADGDTRPVDVRSNLDRPVPVSTPYGTMFPPDLSKGNLRVGGRAEDLYRVISLGVPGSAMPAWSDAFSEKDLWSLVYLIRSAQSPPP